MGLWLQQIVDGLAAGAIYGALALALVLIYRATHIVNFGQGEMATFGAYLAWQFMQWGLPMWGALCAAALASALLGLVVFRLVVRPVSRASVETVVVVTLGLFLVFDALSLWLWGPDQRAFPSLFPDLGWTFGGVRVTAAALGVLVALAVLSAALGALFRYTRFGLAMRASAAEREKSVLVGIRVESMLMAGWGLAAVVGFAAAVLVAPRLFLSPTMMAPVLIYALASATLGGWDSPVGAVLGGLLVGVAESVGAAFIGFLGADLRLAVPIVVTLAVLLLKPAGLFGRQGVVRV